VRGPYGFRFKAGKGIRTLDIQLGKCVSQVPLERKPHCGSLNTGASYRLCRMFLRTSVLFRTAAHGDDRLPLVMNASTRREGNTAALASQDGLLHYENPANEASNEGCNHRRNTSHHSE
jgi:hypothetical protein